MPPAQGSKFAVLASPDDEEKKPQQSSKNAKKNAKKKQQQAKTAEVVKTKPQTPVTKKASPTSDITKQQPAPVPAPKSTKEQAKPSSPKSSAQKQPKVSPTVCPVAHGSGPEVTAKPLGSTVQNIFIWSVSACYLFAFVSFYYQIRGLYGDEGVLPLQHYVSTLAGRNKTIGPDELYAQTGSIVWQIARLGFSLTSALEIVTLLGVLLSFIQLLCGSFRVAPNYVVLYLLYYSITKVGQTFLQFQWDALLLEVGVLTALASIRGRFAPDSRLVLWPSRWLLFKLMFSSGVVKLTSRCPLWWSLSSLDIHFESQCIPTALAWYFHHLPRNWLHLLTALTYVVEILGPFLFFVPLKSARRFSFITQALFQLMIILTGNYNFFNLLTLTLCFSLIECPGASQACPAKNSTRPAQTCRYKLAMQGIFFGLVTYFVVHYFAVTLDQVHSVVSFVTVGPSSKINFTFEDFNLFLSYAITTSIWLGVVSLLHVALRAVLFSISSGCIFTRAIKLTTTLMAIVLCAAVLAISVVPLAELDTSGQYLGRIPSPIKRWYNVAQSNGLVSGYGLFRVMTGKDGRPELIIEGTNDPNSETWAPYHFKYKPGDLTVAPRFNIPHQPRLDWQMWFAALGTYQGNQWLVNLCYRLLTAQPDVLNLLDTRRLPFPVNSPPKYLRVSRYLYKFTELNESDWWKQTSNRHAYLPVVNKDTLAAALKLDEIAVPTWIQKLSTTETTQHPTVKLILDQLYQLVVVQGSALLEPHLTMCVLFLAAFFYQWSRCTKKRATSCPMSSGQSA